jgi:type IV pilus assembly protein PilB
VLSTLHTNSAADTVVRLQKMGLESFNLISALQCIVAQRLARRICVKCREPDPSLKPEYLISLGVAPDVAARSTAYKGRGCEYCNKSGYKGRTAVHEVMVINDNLREAIMKGAPAMTLKKIAMAAGMRTLRQNALLKMLRGETDALEVVANTASDDETLNPGSAA